jgi:hypothetical protein
MVCIIYKTLVFAISWEQIIFDGPSATGLYKEEPRHTIRLGLCAQFPWVYGRKITFLCDCIGCAPEETFLHLFI